MSVTRYLYRMAGDMPVITSPTEVDTTTAGQLRAILLEWHRRGFTTVVVDMTGTQFCDSAGLRELAWAHNRAVAHGGGLRLVIPPDGAVLRVFTVTGLDRIIPHFASREQALAAAAGRRLRPAQVPAERPLIKPTLAGLRFARNWIGCGTGLEDVIQTGGQDVGIRRITQWTWRPVREPEFASFPPRGQAWELGRYQNYQAHLAGHAIGETVGRAVTFLTLTGANTVSAPAVSADLRH